MSKASQPRKHHYVQAAHIRLFTNQDKKVWVYPKNGSKFLASPHDMFAKKDLNSFAVDGKMNTDFEAAVSKVEDLSWGAIKRIADGGSLEDCDLEKVCLYMALSRTRNPSTQSAVIGQLKSVVETTTKMIDRRGEFDHLGPIPGNSVGGVSELIDSGIIGIDVNNSKYIESFHRLLEANFRVLIGGFKWSLIHSPARRVLLSDHPITFVHPGKDFGPYSIPFGGEDCEVAFPISPSVYLIGLWQKKLDDVKSDDAVDELNKRQSFFASRFMVGPNSRKSIAGLAARYRSWSFQVRTETLDFGTGAYLISRGTIFRSSSAENVKLKSPLLGTKSVLQRA